MVWCSVVRGMGSAGELEELEELLWDLNGWLRDPTALGAGKVDVAQVGVIGPWSCGCCIR